MVGPIRPASAAVSSHPIPDLVKLVVSTVWPSLSVVLLFAVTAGGCAKEPVAVATADAKSPKAEGGNKKGEGGGGRSGRGGRGATGQKQSVEVIEISRRDLSESLRVVGSLAANETATIRPEMNGLIRSIHFEEGRRVKKGDLLVKIDDSELQAQLAQSKSRHELAKLNLARAENLRQTQSNTQADVDRVRSEFSAAEADIDLLKVRLARTEVRAPFEGVVEARTLSPGDYINTQSIITTINDLSRLKVEFQVPERYIGKVRPGTKFSMKSTTAEQDAAADGEVYFVNSVIDRNTRSSEVKGFLTKAPATVKAGMFAVIEIVLEVRIGALTVPEGAIFVDQRGPQIVTVVDEADGKVAVFVPVRLGLRTRGVVEVTAVKGELAEKLPVVAAGVGSLALFPGAKLDPRPLRAEFLTNQ
jgi:membrane fusion protein (multidrug efflux system)